MNFPDDQVTMNCENIPISPFKTHFIWQRIETWFRLLNNIILFMRCSKFKTDCYIGVLVMIYRYRWINSHSWLGLDKSSLAHLKYRLQVLNQLWTMEDEISGQLRSLHNAEQGCLLLILWLPSFTCKLRIAHKISEGGHTMSTCDLAFVTL